MRFRISCKSPTDNSTAAYLYDNLTNEIWDSSGNLMDFRSDEHFVEIPPFIKTSPAFPMSESNPLIGKYRKVNVLKIQLGLRCNYHCSYCLQSTWRDKGRTPKESDADAFMEKLDKAGIEIKQGGHIELWGGEPLVYIKVLRRLIPLLHRRFNVIISMVTNGSLLTKELVDFFYENNVKIAISHDGPGFSLRHDKDPLSIPSIRDVWLYAHNKSKGTNLALSFNVVITPKNCNLKEVRDFFKTNFSPDVRVGFESIVTNIGVGEGTFFDKEKACQLEQSIFELMMQGEDTLNLMDFAGSLLRKLVHRFPSSSLTGRCNQIRKETLVTDLFGTIGVCQNRSPETHRIGKIENLEKVKNGYMTHWSLRSNCRNCPMLPSCKGGCPVLSTQEYQSACHNEYIFHFAIFKVVWAWLTGKIIVDVTDENGRESLLVPKRAIPIATIP